MGNVNEITVLLIAVSPIHPGSHRAVVSASMPLINIGMIDTSLWNPGPGNRSHVQ